MGHKCLPAQPVNYKNMNPSKKSISEKLKLRAIVFVVLGMWPLILAAESTLLIANKSETLITPQQSEVAGSSTLQTLRGLLNFDQTQPEFLDPEVAYRIELNVLAPKNLLAKFTIEDGYYLYQEKTRFSSLTDGVTIENVMFPEGKRKVDEFFGEQIVYYNGMEVDLPLTRTRPEPEEVKIQVDYQGCAEKGICYPPMNKVFTLNLPGISDALASHSLSDNADKIATSEPDDFAATDMVWPILRAFVAGLALTFTPCVLPTIPILASIIVGQRAERSRTRAGFLSLVYVMGTATTYTAVGVLAGATGDQLQAYFQNPWGIGLVVGILVLLTLSMFGVYDLQMPTAIQSRLQAHAGRLKAGTFGAVFFMGVISALIVGACVSPVLMAVLGLAIDRADPVLGGLIMFSLAMGSGVLLVALGIGAGFLLPKAGPWMDRVKHVFGVLLLGVAIYILGALPAVPVLYLWGAYFIIVGVYLGALQSLPVDVSGWRYLYKGIGVVLLIWGFLALLGGMTGNRNILQPIDLSRDIINSGIFPKKTSKNSSTQSLFSRVSDLEALDVQLLDAKSSNRPVMLDYYADWCIDCVRMEDSTFSDPAVRDELETFVMLQVDVTDPRNLSTNAVKKRYGVFGPPAMLFFNANGEEEKGLRRYGFMGPEEFIAHIKTLKL